MKARKDSKLNFDIGNFYLSYQSIMFTGNDIYLNKSFFKN